MYIKMKSTVGSWHDGLELEVNDEYASTLIKRGHAVQIQDKRVRGLKEVVEQRKELAEAMAASEAAKESDKVLVRGKRA